jgi:hypothetical protein
MLAMGKRRKLGGVGVRLTLLVVACATGCSRPVGLQSGGDSQAPAPQTVPFHQDSDAATNSGTRPDAPLTANQEEGDEAAARGVPFNKGSSRLLPAGTLLTIRLENSLSSGRLDSGRTFIAGVDDPVVIGGSTIVSREARVKGRVESARVFDVRRDAAYIRLTLESIRIGDRDVPVQTSSLFARGTVSGAYSVTPHSTQSQLTQPANVRLKKGRRLTFRLNEPVDLGTGDEPISKTRSPEAKTPATND